MAGDPIAEQYVIECWPGADIVDDQRMAASETGSVGNDTDVGQVARQHPGHQIARFIAAGLTGDGKHLAVPAKEGLQIRHPAMIDIAVGTGQAPHSA